MNWFKIASFFIDRVTVVGAGPSSISLVLDGKLYNYINLNRDGYLLKRYIEDMKRVSNPGVKKKNSELLNNIIENLKPFLVKDTVDKVPLKPFQQGRLF
jgi:hypothetical protein